MERIIPVAVINGLKETKPLLNALKSGGINTAEITFRTACAADAIKLAIKEFPQMNIGAGTVINAAQCKAAVNAGARFIVSPGFSQEVLDECKKANAPYYPGCVTPTEIMTAIAAGIDVVKFFPAQVYGGLVAINALGAAFPKIKFIPTGGVDNSNLAEYLNNPKVYAVGGSWMMKGGYDNIAELSKEAVKILEEAQK